VSAGFIFLLGVLLFCPFLARSRLRGCACASSRSPRSLGHNGAIFRPWGWFPVSHVFGACWVFFSPKKNSLPQCAGCWVPWCCAVVRLRTPISGSHCSAQYFGLHRDGEVALPHPTGIFFRVAERDTMSHQVQFWVFFGWLKQLEPLVMWTTKNDCGTPTHQMRQQ